MESYVKFPNKDETLHKFDIGRASNPRYACMFIERACPRDCNYCGSKDVVPDFLLRPKDWIRNLDILSDVGVEFFLILGNEVLLYPWIVELVEKLDKNGYYGKYAMYSTFVEPQYSKLRQKLVDAGLYNISCGVDAMTEITGDKDIDAKSITGLQQLQWFKQKGVPDVQGTITIHRQNYKQIPELLEYMTSKEIWAGLNYVEHPKGPNYDFFSNDIDNTFLFREQDKEDLLEVMKTVRDMVKSGKVMVQNPPEYFIDGVELAPGMKWHCTSGLNIDIEADGSLRSCSYSNHMKKRINVSDLAVPGNRQEIFDTLYSAKQECPGCFWSYTWFADFYAKKNGLGNILDNKFKSHYSEHYVHG